MKKSFQLLRYVGLLGAAAIWAHPARHQAGTNPYHLIVPPGLPTPPLPPNNPLTVQGVALGQRLFSEVLLSGNKTQACLSCHHPNEAFSNEGMQFSVGSTGTKGTRNAPALFNLPYQHLYFWDGASSTLHDQALVPIQNPKEMNQTLAQAVKNLNADPTYPGQFAKAFGSPGITAQRIGLALEQYETTLLAGYSKYDLYLQGKASLTSQELRGLSVFKTPFNPRNNQFGGDCARCHSGPLMSDFAFRNNGLDAHPADPGREDVTNNPADYGKFKTPSVRNLTLSGPYMHDGRFTTLEQVVEHYSSGIEPSSTLDPGLAHEPGGVQLSANDQAALVAFLKTLVDPPSSGNVVRP